MGARIKRKTAKRWLNKMAKRPMLGVTMDNIDHIAAQDIKKQFENSIKNSYIWRTPVIKRINIRKSRLDTVYKMLRDFGFLRGNK